MKPTGMAIEGLSTLEANYLVEELPEESSPDIVQASSAKAGQQGDFGLATVTFVLSAMAVSGLVAWLLKDRSEKKTEIRFKLTFPGGVSMESTMMIDEVESQTSEAVAKSVTEVFSALAGVASPP